MVKAAPPQPTTKLQPTCAGSGDEREALAGSVERVTFDSPETGFCVPRVKLRGQRDLVTVVGHAPPFPPAGSSRPTVKAAYLCAAPPTTVQGIERYLRLGLHGHRPSPRRRRPIRPLPPLTGS